MILYKGNSGQRTHWQEEPAGEPRPAEAQHRPSHSAPKPRQRILPGLERLSRLLPEKAGELETEDILLLLILYLMYRESGDSDLLMILGAMFLL